MNDTAQATAEVEAPPAEVPEAPVEPAITPEQLHDLLTAHDAVEEAETAYADAKENATAAKKELDGAHAQVSRILREIKTGVPEMPLFENGKEADNGGWRNIGLGELNLHGLKPRTFGRLIDGGLTTIGALEDHRNEYGDDWPDTIPGIGGKAKEEVEKALLTFWSTRPVETPQPEGAEDDSPQDGTDR